MTLILTDYQDPFLDQEYFEQFNWAVFKTCDIVWLEDYDHVDHAQHIAAVFVTKVNGNVYLRIVPNLAAKLLGSTAYIAHIRNLTGQYWQDFNDGVAHIKTNLEKGNIDMSEFTNNSNFELDQTIDRLQKVAMKISAVDFEIVFGESMGSHLWNTYSKFNHDLLRFSATLTGPTRDKFVDFVNRAMTTIWSINQSLEMLSKVKGQGPSLAKMIEVANHHIEHDSTIHARWVTQHVYKLTKEFEQCPPFGLVTPFDESTQLFAFEIEGHQTVYIKGPRFDRCKEYIEAHYTPNGEKVTSVALLPD